MNETEFIKSISVLTVQPGDVIVIKTERPMRAEQRQNISQILIDVLTNNGIDNQVLILDCGLDIGVLHKQNAETQADTAIKETH